jgi:hypothetical protein
MGATLSSDEIDICPAKKSGLSKGAAPRPDGSRANCAFSLHQANGPNSKPRFIDLLSG